MDNKVLKKRNFLRVLICVLSFSFLICLAPSSVAFASEEGSEDSYGYINSGLSFTLDSAGSANISAMDVSFTVSPYNAYRLDLSNGKSYYFSFVENNDYGNPTYYRRYYVRLAEISETAYLTLLSWKKNDALYQWNVRFGSSYGGVTGVIYSANSFTDPSDLLDAVNFYTGVLGKYVDTLFALPLYKSVSVGSFLLGCSVFSIVLGYLIGRFTLSSGQAESAGSKAGSAFKDKKDGD